MTLKSTIIAFVISLKLVTGLLAQPNPITFEHISLEQGLSQSVVTCILQDYQGFMWFGTYDGLNKFDGYDFVVYKHDLQNPHSLSDNTIQALFEDSAGMLWIGTREGLCRFDPRYEKITRYLHNPNDPHSLSHNTVTAICETRDGEASALWIGTQGGGLNRFDPESGRFNRYQRDATNLASLSSNQVRSLHVSYQNNTTTLWIGTFNGLNRLVLSTENSGENAEISFIRYQHDPNNPQSLSDNRVWSIAEDANGVLWLATFGGGLNRFDPAALTFTRYLHDPNNPASLSNNTVRPILISQRDSTIWIGTSGGLEKFEAPTQRFIHHQHDETNSGSLSNDDVWSLYEDKSGALWIGTYGGGLNKFSPAREKFMHIRHDPMNHKSLGHNMVMAIHEAREGDETTLWIGTGGGGLYEYDASREAFIPYRHNPANPASLSSDGVAAIYQDHRGALWVGTGVGLNKMLPGQKRFKRYLREPANPYSLSENGISAIAETRHGEKSFLWIGTGSAGLNRFDPQTERFQRYRHNPADSTSLSNDRIYALYVEPEANGDSRSLWVGTDAGLNQLVLDDAALSNNGASMRFVRYQQKPAGRKGLSNNRVFAIYADPDSINHSLWVGTWGGGLNRLNRATDEFTHFTEKDGLPNNVIYGILGDDDGNLWLSTNSGLSKLILNEAEGFNPATSMFRNYDVDDGLQSKEFNQGAYYKSHDGEMFFGGINGFNRFYPRRVRDNPYTPPIVLTAFEKFDRLVPLEKAISASDKITLTYRDSFFSFAFAALDYTNPGKNQYAYKLEGFDEDWIYCGTRRYASYTNLDGGEYLFRVKGSNHDGVWNEEGASIKIIVTPPFWKTWWFLSLAGLAVLGLAYGSYRRKLDARLEKERIVNELKAAHEMQMGLMPTAAPQVEGFDIAGICQPAEAVGGDFFDYFWLDFDKNQFGLMLVDVSDKAMKGAMTAVMTSGMVSAEIGYNRSPHIIMQNVNRAMYWKTSANAFTAMLFATINPFTKIMRFTNAGLTRPLLRRGSEIIYLKVEGAHFPLGIQQEVKYQESELPLQSGDVLVFYTDGLPEAMNAKEELFDYPRLERLLRGLPDTLSAAEIINSLVQKVQNFTGNAERHDDMTIVVVRVK